MSRIVPLIAIPLVAVGLFGSGPARADAIVVLTGGPERIETGFRLLVEGRHGALAIK